MTTHEKAVLKTPSKQEKIRVLLVEDDEDDYVLTRTLVSSQDNVNIRLDWIDNYDDALKAIQRREYDVYLVDYRLGERTGIDLIQEAFRLGSNAPMILLTGQDDLAVDYSALELGAADYLVKGRIDPQLLGRSIRYALRQAETLNELVKNENKYRALFERSMDAIFVMDDKMAFQDANPAVEQMLGYTRNDLKRLNVARLFASVDALRTIRYTIREQNQLKDYETTLISRNGRKRICLVSIWSVDDVTGTSNWYQGIIRDVTEQKRAQQELVLAEKLTITGQIARSIAHEVRNPLTNLSLALEQLKEELPEDDQYTVVFTDIIHRNVERIGQLITEMLNSSKPRDLDRKPQNLSLIAQDTLRLVADRLKLKSMQLTTDFCLLPCIALLDHEQIKTALLNIFINAVEAMEPEQGALRVQTYCTDDEQVCVEVQDNGSGISEENRQRLFDPFFTAKSTGMGLGLTTTQNIINSHKGTIDVFSKLGTGTTFRLCFPRSEPPNELG